MPTSHNLNRHAQRASEIVRNWNSYVGNPKGCAMSESVYCLGCGGEFDGDTDPYPLSNGMCAKCVREARRPVASILAENERLRAEVDRLHGEKDEAQRQEHMAKNEERDYELQTRVLNHVRAEFEDYKRAALTRDMSPEFVAEFDALRQQHEGAVDALRDIQQAVRAQSAKARAAEEDRDRWEEGAGKLAESYAEKRDENFMLVDAMRDARALLHQVRPAAMKAAAVLGDALQRRAEAMLRDGDGDDA